MIEPKSPVKFAIDLPAPALLTHKYDISILRRSFYQVDQNAAQTWEWQSTKFNALDSEITDPAECSREFPRKPQAQSPQEPRHTQEPRYMRLQHSIRERDEKTSWYRSIGQERLNSPSTSLSHYSHELGTGDLYIHLVGNSVSQAWMWTGKFWEVIGEGGNHPILAGYCFHILKSGEPTWVTGKTLATYQSRYKHRLR
ncbi:hypothetical protein BJ138DRAFT_1105653 [Hygrophoropsis aurantiaca]|uniref:Uncharacterized protein n=1 Tax=Hygrophoropsis aurantiaca TaxID=72124 RepID=A0ACB7ZXL6_9AGAM|nr:hypothetical protein BJ138DRAFT_1105653 [Hygrophoropsis aurantiaca]